MNITTLKSEWQDNESYHSAINEKFRESVTNHPVLDAHRTYVEENVWGFGERSFWWMWKFILEELPEYPRLLEVGVFKGATISVWKLLREDAQVFGVTPLDDTGLEWQHEPGYYADAILQIHDEFELEQPTLIVGMSDEPNVLAQSSGNYDVIYVDGGHSTETALADLNNYAPMVKVGGFLVIDDCCCDMHMPFGYFQGIDTVQAGFDAWDKTGFEFVTNCVHLRVMRRVS